MGPIKVILNPVAGRGYGSKAEPQIRAYLKEEGLDFDLTRTEGHWHAAELAEEAATAGFEVIVAAGGDGTTNEVVNGLMAASAGSVAGMLGIIPVGSGSDFARAAGVPPDLRGACQRLAQGQPRLVDVGLARLPGQTSRYFDNTLGIGFDGQVTLEARRFMRLRGMALYLPVVLKTIFISYKPPLVTIDYDGQRIEQRSLMIVVANGPREGSSFYVAPDAAPDDGYFDLCIAKELSRLGMLAMVPEFMKGTHVNKEPITMARARRVTITSEDNLVAHMDGEMLCTEGHQITCEIVPQALRIWV